MPTHLSPYNLLALVEQIPQGQNTDSSNPINKLAETTADNASQQHPQTSSALFKPTAKNTLVFEGKNEKLELLEDLSQTMLKMQPEISEAKKVNHFNSRLRKQTLQTFRNINTSNEQTLESVFIIFKQESTSDHNHKPQRNTKGMNLFLILTQKHSQISLKNEMNVSSELSGIRHNRW